MCRHKGSTQPLWTYSANFFPKPERLCLRCYWVSYKYRNMFRKFAKNRTVKLSLRSAVARGRTRKISYSAQLHSFRYTTTSIIESWFKDVRLRPLYWFLCAKCSRRCPLFCATCIDLTVYGIDMQRAIRTFLPERDYVTFGSLLSQFRLSSVVCLSVCLSVCRLSVCNVGAPYSGG